MRHMARAVLAGTSECPRDTEVAARDAEGWRVSVLELVLGLVWVREPVPVLELVLARRVLLRRRLRPLRRSLR